MAAAAPCSTHGAAGTAQPLLNGLTNGFMLA
jgi:hypothetical protein